MAYLIYVVVALLVGFWVFKKITGCMIRMVITAILVAIFAALYFGHILG